MANALFEDDVDLHLIAKAVKAGWRFKSGRGWVSIRPPGGGASVWYGKGLTRISVQMLACMPAITVPLPREREPDALLFPSAAETPG
jgi:hypothetical protein